MELVWKWDISYAIFFFWASEIFLHIFVLSLEQFVSSSHFCFSMTCIYDVIFILILLKVYLKHTSVKMEIKT